MTEIIICQDFEALIVAQQTAVAPPSATAHDAARQMAERRVGAVAVVGKGERVGIFTEHDLLIDARAVACGLRR
jgi:CBS domain-containing protein